MTHEALLEDMEALAQQIADGTRAHTGRLSAITIAVPVRVSARVRRDVEASLVHAGIDFVDITVEQDPGPLRVLHAEYEA